MYNALTRPRYLRIGRNYAEFAYSLDDGATWKVCNTNELSSARKIYAGVEASAYNTSRLVTFEFDDFELDLPPVPGTVVTIR